jgi:hypothetical protein
MELTHRRPEAVSWTPVLGRIMPITIADLQQYASLIRGWEPIARTGVLMSGQLKQAN